MVKLITYDLCNNGKNYDKLITAIKQLPGCIKLTESCWLNNSTKTCREIADSLLPSIDNDDRLFVAVLTGVAAWVNMLTSDEKVKQILNS